VKIDAAPVKSRANLLNGAPALANFTAAERRVIKTYRTPREVQRWLNRLPYNTERAGPTQRSFREVVRLHTAHCLEGALAAAVILEQHGYPPRVLSFESIDQLDHVIYVYQRNGLWGSIARSRDPGLHGRKPVFKTARALALSYVDPYVDFTGAVKAYAVVDLRDLMGRYDWRLSPRNLWKVEQALIHYPHRPIRSSPTRIERLREKYRVFVERHGKKPLFYSGREHWTPLPKGGW
jgi:hypothetical protein